VVACLPLRAAVLIHDFTLRGTLADRLGAGSLTAVGGQITALGYVSALNQGLTLASPTMSNGNYSVEFSFRLGAAVGSMKLLDLHGLNDSTGLFVSNGQLAFSPLAVTSNATLASGRENHVVLTRDGATGVVRGFLNGQQAFAFADPAGVGIVTPAGLLNFFREIPVSSPDLGQANTLTGIRVYNGALSSAEIGNLYAAMVAVPEPSVVMLLLSGLGAAAVTLLRRRRRE